MLKFISYSNVDAKVAERAANKSPSRDDEKMAD